jgi:hypothetical protein
MKVQFEIVCGTVADQGPYVEIYKNEMLIHDLHMDSFNLLTIDLDNSVNNIISIVHKNKQDKDTVIKNGIIVADKYVKVNKIWVDDILLFELLCYTNCELLYSSSYLNSITESPPSQTHADNLYFNGRLVYKFSRDFFQWYYNFKKELDMQYLLAQPDSEAEQKFLGYQQDSLAEQEIVALLESHGYHITN